MSQIINIENVVTFLTVDLIESFRQNHSTILADKRTSPANWHWINRKVHVWFIHRLGLFGGKCITFNYIHQQNRCPPPLLSQCGWKAGYEYGFGLRCSQLRSLTSRTVLVNDLSCEHRRPNHTKFECRKFQNWLIKLFTIIIRGFDHLISRWDWYS